MKQYQKELLAANAFQPEEIEAFLKQYEEIPENKNIFELSAEMEDIIQNFSIPTSQEVYFLTDFLNHIEEIEGELLPVSEEEVQTMIDILTYQEYRTDNEELSYYSCLWKFATADYWENQIGDENAKVKTMLLLTGITSLCAFSSIYFRSMLSTIGVSGMLLTCMIAYHVFNDHYKTLQQKYENISYLSKYFMIWGILYGCIDSHLTPISIVSIPLALLLSSHFKKEAGKQYMR